MAIQTYLLNIFGNGLIYKYSHLGDFDDAFEPLCLCSHGMSHVLKGQCEYEQQNLQHKINFKANICLNFLLGLSKMIPSKDDVDSFMKNYLNCNSEYIDSFIIQSFDASCYLNEEILIIRNSKLIFDRFSEISEETTYFPLSYEDEV